MSRNITEWLAGVVLDEVPQNAFRATDGTVVAFPYGEAELLAVSAHEPMFKLTRDYGWGCRWYAVHRLSHRYILTVGHGYWAVRREIPPGWLQPVLSGLFSRNELSDEAKALLETQTQKEETQWQRS